MNKSYKLPEVLEKELKQRGMSQNQLADKLNLSPEAIHKWMHFKCVPSLFSLMAIAKILDKSLDYLVYGESYEKRK